jgi:tetratricopeptide (TPR) repeat protein
MFRTMTGILGMILVLFLLVPAGFAQSALSNCKYYTKTQQDFVQGLPYCEECLKEEPENPEARYYAGWCLAEVGRYEDAWQAFKWLIDRKNDKDKKISKHAKWALERVQSYYAYHFNRGVELLNSEDTEGAYQEFLWATQIKPIEADAYLNLGFVQTQLGDLDGAIESFRTAQRNRPNDATGSLYLVDAIGRRLAQEDELENPDEELVASLRSELKSALKSIVAADPSNDAALLRLGSMEFAAGNEDSAIGYVKRAIEIDAGNIQVLYNYGVDYYNANNFASAENIFKTVSDEIGDPKEPLWQDANYMLGVCQLYTENYEACIATLENLVKADPEDPEYFNILGRAYAKNGDMEKASEAVQQYQRLKAGATSEGVADIEDIPE